MSKLNALLEKINKEHKEELGAVGIGRKAHDRIPFSSPKLNYATYGGIPIGRAIEFYGEEHSGKTTAAIDIAANAQKLFQDDFKNKEKDLKEIIKSAKSTKAQKAKAEDELKTLEPKKVVFFDCENAYDAEWAEKLGVDNSKIIMMRPSHQSADVIFDMIEEMVETGEIGLVIVDSLGSMVSSLEMDKKNGEKTYGGISTELTRFSKKIVGPLRKFNTTLIGINQVREDLGNPYNKYKTPGGQSWKHACSVRIMFSEGRFIDKVGEEIKKGLEGVGKNLNVYIEKNKTAKNDRKNGSFLIHFDKGMYKELDMIELAMLLGFIEQSGAWFQILDSDGCYIKDGNKDLKIQGKPKTIKYLKENPNVYNQLKSLVDMEIMGGLLDENKKNKDGNS